MKNALLILTVLSLVLIPTSSVKTSGVDLIGEYYQFHGNMPTSVYAIQVFLVERENERLALPDLLDNYIDDDSFFYKQATRGTDIPWQVISAIHYAETRRQNYTCVVSTAGARGPFQFMPGTWRAYKKDGNRDNYIDICAFHDSLHSAVFYLQSNVTAGNPLWGYGGAVWHYNHDMNYVYRVKQEAERLGYVQED